MKRFSIKQILVTNQNWWNFHTKYKDKIREAIVIGIVKLLSCKHPMRGHKEYHCSNPNCSHVKYIRHTCKAKSCSSCGKKATEVWIQQQMAILPNTAWQHITFTMPSTLWDCFWTNRELLNLLPPLAAKVLLKLAKNKRVKPGVFIALHTFGRDLKRNVHLHASITLGGINKELTQWKSLYFHQPTLMSMWRYEVINLFRNHHQDKGLILPNQLASTLNHTFNFNQLLDQLYQKRWVVHCAKPSKNHKQNVKYLGRYTKRPPIAESKIKNFDGSSLSFNYLDHVSKTYKQFKLTAEEFIARFIQHIPDVGFRMVRYYGFLANRVRGEMLPKVRLLLGETDPNTPQVNYRTLMQNNFNIDPYECVLCGSQMFLANCWYRQPNRYKLLSKHRELALLKKI